VSPALVLIAGVVAAIVGINIFVNQVRLRELRKRLTNDWGSARDIDRDMDAVASYHESVPGGGLLVDERTWSDLTMDRIFAQLDRTESAPGRQYLYHRLHQLAPDDREAFEEAVRGVATDQNRRIEAQMSLAMIAADDAHGLWRLAHAEPPEIPSRYAIFPFLGGLSILSLIAIPFYHPAFVGLIAVMFASIWVRAATDQKLAEIRPVFRQIGPMMAAAQNLARLKLPGTSAWSAELSSLLERTARLRTVTRWVARDSSTQDQLAAAVYEYFNLAFAVDGNALYFGVTELRAHRADLGRIIELVGKIDAAISIASWRSRRDDWRNPSFVPRGAPAKLAGIRHPLVDDCVSASVDLAPPHGLIVTGSNMSGKSTFLRTVGANVLLAQSINTVLADSYSAPMLGVRSCIGRSDDITTGTSYYMAEVRAVLSMVRTAEDRQQHLFLFDELFRGTNTAERIAAGQAVLENIVHQPAGHLVIAATHDGELVDRLRDSYSPVHFSEQLTPAGLTFDYQLRPGRATTRNAIALLELEGAPAVLVDRARSAL
jgi:hypothetical protein